MRLRTREVVLGSIFSLSLFLLAACGGGGGGGSSGGGVPPSGGGDGGNLSIPQTYLFYKGGGLWAVDPANPASPIQVETGTPVATWETISGIWDATNQKATELYSRAVLYVGGDGRIYKLSALKSDSLAPNQVSNESGAAKVCDSGLVSDFASHDNSAYLYELPGPDGDCSASSDNVWKLVRVGMGPSDNPIVAKPPLREGLDLDLSERYISLWDKMSGAIIGWLARDGQNLVRCDRDFQNCNTVTSFTSEVLDLGVNPFSGFLILKIDNALHSYNVSTGVLTASLYTLPLVSPWPEVDSADFYFADGATLLKMPLDGSSGPSALVTENGNFTNILLTADSVVYSLSDGGSPPSYTLKTVNKSGGLPTTLVPATTDPMDGFITWSGSWIYYNKGDAAGFVKEDGTGRVEISSARWVGIEPSTTFAASLGSDWQVVRLFRVEGCSTSSCAGGILKSIDAATNSDEVILGTLPSDLSSISFFSGMGATSLGIGWGTGQAADIFYVAGDQANSLVRVTNTPAIDEVPLL